MADEPREQIPLAKQIACVEREIAMRESAYPKWVKNGRMKETTAAYELKAMRAVLVTLQGLQEPEGLPRVPYPQPRED